MLRGGEACPDYRGVLDIPLALLFFLEDLEGLVRGFGFCDRRIRQVGGYEDFLADGVLIRPVAPAGDLLCRVRDGVRGDRLIALGQGFGDNGFLLTAQSVEPGRGCRVFLPRQITPLEILVEFGFFGFQPGQLPQGQDRDHTSFVAVAIAEEASAEVEDFGDSLKPTLPGH